MSPIERADLGTNWRESTTSNGRKYYYNRFAKNPFCNSSASLPWLFILSGERLDTRGYAERQSSPFGLCHRNSMKLVSVHVKRCSSTSKLIRQHRSTSSLTKCSNTKLQIPR